MEGLYIPDYYECECGSKVFNIIAYSRAEYNEENPLYAELTCLICKKECEIDIEDSPSCWGLVQSKISMLDKSTIEKISKIIKENQ